jgi:hypothetical protein
MACSTSVQELNEELDEMLTFAEVMARQGNMITVDENGPSTAPLTVRWKKSFRYYINS